MVKTTSTYTLRKTATWFDTCPPHCWKSRDEVTCNAVLSRRGWRQKTQNQLWLRNYNYKHLTGGFTNNIISQKKKKQAQTSILFPSGFENKSAEKYYRKVCLRIPNFTLISKKFRPKIRRRCFLFILTLALKKSKFNHQLIKLPYWLPNAAMNHARLPVFVIEQCPIQCPLAYGQKQIRRKLQRCRPRTEESKISFGTREMWLLHRLVFTFRSVLVPGIRLAWHAEVHMHAVVFEPPGKNQTLFLTVSTRRN